MTEKLAPTKEGWYQLTNGIIGYLKGPDEASDWRISLNPGNAIFFRKTGEIITKNIVGDEDGWQIAKYLGDVLPWEECEQLEGLLVHAKKEYASLLEACEADRQARLKLVEECERLKTGIVQSAISCGLTPADSDTATGTSAEELDKQLRAVLSERDELQERFEALKDSAEQYLSERNNLHVESKVLQAEIKVLKAERDEAQKNWEQIKRELNDAHYRIAQQSIRIQNQTRATQEAATHWHDRVLEKIKHLLPDEINQHGHPIEQLVGMVVTVLESKLQYAEILKQAIERPRSEVSTLTEIHQKQIVDLQDRVSKLEKATKPESIMKIVMDTPMTGLSFELNEAMPQENEPLPAVTDAVQAEKEVCGL